jgi:hypothetical protein
VLECELRTRLGEVAFGIFRATVRTRPEGIADLQGRLAAAE